MSIRSCCNDIIVDSLFIEHGSRVPKLVLSKNKAMLVLSSFVYVIPALVHYRQRNYTGTSLYSCITVAASVYHYQQHRYSQHVTPDIYVVERIDFVFANIAATYSFLLALIRFKKLNLVSIPFLIAGWQFKVKNCECTYPVRHSIWHILSAIASAIVAV